MAMKVGIPKGKTAAQMIDGRIKELDDWRGALLARLRAIITSVGAGVVEEWKWGVPVWSCDGIITTGEVYKQVVKLTFAKGASLPDPAKLFNSSREGATRRAIDFRAGEKVNEKALKALVRAAMAHNAGGKKPAAAKVAKPKATKAKAPAVKARKPVSLPKSVGEAGVKAFIASMEPWQAALVKRVNAIVDKQVPGVIKAVKWHCPFYGIEGKGWFLSFAAFQFHVKFTFFKGKQLKPVPPAGTGKEARSIDIRQSDTFDEKQMTAWIKQAAAIPGWDGGSRKSGGTP
jgi:hypothetical protein